MLSDHLRHTHRTWSKQTGSGQVSIQKGRAKKLLHLRTQFLPLLSFSSTHLPARAVTEHFCLPSILIQTREPGIASESCRVPWVLSSQVLVSICCVHLQHRARCAHTTPPALGCCSSPILPFLTWLHAVEQRPRPEDQPSVLQCCVKWCLASAGEREAAWKHLGEPRKLAAPHKRRLITHRDKVPRNKIAPQAFSKLSNVFPQERNRIKATWHKAVKYYLSKSMCISGD